MADIPERHVRLASLPDAAIAKAAEEELQKNGIPAYTGSGFHRGRSDRELYVPESYEAEAREILTAFDIGERTDPNLICPRCSATRVKAQPPVAVIVTLAGVAAAVLIFLFAEPKWLGAILFAGAIIAAAVIERRVGNWKCLNCGAVWLTKRS
ncbi:MAG: hypothetical protein DMF56_14300 [Acidobacteria bacterium]|nr:MAG: hypothetical protein DMF56_14300 [Acidobacteriota bacterium]